MKAKDLIGHVSLCKEKEPDIFEQINIECKDLSAMKLHDQRISNGYTILRVPHGWIYTMTEEMCGTNKPITSVYVPQFRTMPYKGV